MIRNYLALICGIFLSFLLVGVAGFILANFKIPPFYEFMIGNSRNFFEPDSRLLEEMMYIDIFVTFPIITFTTGLISGLIAKRKEYLIGIISIIPLFIIFNIYSFSINSIYTCISFLISVVFGVFISKSLKKKVNEKSKR